MYETKTAGLVAIRFAHDTISATQLLDTLLTLVDVNPKKTTANNTNAEDTSAKTEEKSPENTDASNNGKYQFKYVTTSIFISPWHQLTIIFWKILLPHYAGGIILPRAIRSYCRTVAAVNIKRVYSEDTY